jgi:mannose-6-phosphate isomerase-like protein (cupin superfamily)
MAYEHRSLADFEPNPDKPGRRFELSPELGIEAYNLNVAVLEPGEHLSQNAYHYHENQRELYYAVAGRCRIEVDDGSFDVTEDEVAVFEPGTNHLVHNPFDDSCKLIAIGSPPEDRYPVHQVQSFDALIAERYGGVPTEGGGSLGERSESNGDADADGG